MAFNYKNSTDNELLNHIEKSSIASVSAAKKYHISLGNNEIVERINNSRKILKKKRLIAKLQELLGN